jgi:hypothetical protein
MPGHATPSHNAPRRSVTVRLPPELWEQLSDAAQHEHRSVSQEIEHRCAVFGGSMSIDTVVRGTLGSGRYEMISVSSEGAVVTIQVRRIDAMPESQS